MKKSEHHRFFKCLAVGPFSDSYILGGRFAYFLLFLCSGEGKGESEEPGGGGGDYLLKIPGRGVLPGGWVRGGEGVCGDLGGGAKFFFFSGPKFPPSIARFFFFFLCGESRKT